MLTLLIDTSTERGVVAFAKDGKLIYHFELPIGLQNSKHLIPAIHSGLELLGIALKEFSLIVAGIGPGSYTGIRVGVAAAKAMAYGAAIPLIGVSSLTGFVSQEDGAFAGVIDAKQGGVYVMLGEKKYGKVIHHSLPMVLSIQDAELRCIHVKWLVTPSSEALRFRWKMDSSLCGVEWLERYPETLSMIMCGEEQFKKEKKCALSSLDLLYLKEWQNLKLEHGTL
jgi:tRNA threonylcarbamoyladenosine biosynthesis protein TsaB